MCAAAVSGNVSQETARTAFIQAADEARRDEISSANEVSSMASGPTRPRRRSRSIGSLPAGYHRSDKVFPVLDACQEDASDVKDD
ncbi:DUF982 domain-containing protein [Rhizobium leguminosarum]|uniref:DUF982 domain-containing protein n=1 Tax=Rhizobium leguminosarum TaxID=384 RepID=UPI001FD99627|nr:DUF982 domain-containing protein [Rhizobium leguminosarum]